ncbi:MAG: 50S ribosomal protein L9 [Candidatus Lightella neohaematopini]|nr:50S ribosomal protein L9 [Candidatus Lightella neohaematopini]MCV2524964.1 50S ribosomal protein L9 [Candidatus Lightella neohaematopini]
MIVILLCKINKLGNVGDKVVVKDGYARNFLLPNKKALVANRDNLLLFDNKKIQLEQELAQHKSEIINKINKIKELNNITILAKVGKNNKIFGSINSNHIVKYMKNHGIYLKNKEVNLPIKSIRKVGNYNVTIFVEKKLTVQITLKIKSYNK